MVAGFGLCLLSDLLTRLQSYKTIHVKIMLCNRLICINAESEMLILHLMPCRDWDNQVMFRCENETTDCCMPYCT